MNKRIARILVWVSVGIISLSFLGFLIWGFWPLLIGDGIAGLQGAKKEIAQKAIMIERHHSSISPLPWFVRPERVIEVRPTTAEEKERHCKNPDYTSDDPNDSRYYTAIIEMKYLFNIDKEKHVIDHGCYLQDFFRDFF